MLTLEHFLELQFYEFTFIAIWNFCKILEHNIQFRKLLLSWTFVAKFPPHYETRDCFISGRKSYRKEETSFRKY